MEWDLFIGRFHPLIVHLPIGIFILGYLFEVLYQLGYRNVINSRKLIVITYSIGLIAGIIAGITGWLLSFSDDYGIEPLNDHKYLGIATLLVMLFVIICQAKAPENKSKLKLGFSTTAILLTALTGHFGGNLTHGPSYLVEYGPGFMKNKNSDVYTSVKALNPDSLQIYDHIVKPLFENKCTTCHNNENAKGGLNLQGYNDLFTEADHNIPIVSGNPNSSELFTRVSLPSNHEKAMPPRGEGFGYTNIQILKYWIENGADSLATFNSDKMSKELIALLNRDYELDFTPKPYYEKVKVDSLDEGLLVQLRNSGFRVSYLGQTNFLLDVAFKNDTISKQQIELLNKVSHQATVLNLSNCNLSDELLKQLVPIKHLTRIDLSKNSIGDSTVLYLTNLEHLESVNLEGTNLTSDGLQNLLTTFGKLRAYVRNTKISPQEISNLTQAYPNAQIVSEFAFEKVEPAKSVFRQEEEN